ncbi:MAG: hypothetical protein ACYTE8_04770 [Planctomycetota bacterium]|jgi:hypothetical protein
MEYTDEQVTNGSIESEPILQVNRSLIPLEEYAAREGVSVSIVYECSRTGIVQIRKNKGKCYVVDVPLNPHITELEEKARERGPDESGPAPKRLSDKIKEFSNPEDLMSHQSKLDEITIKNPSISRVAGEHSTDRDYSDAFLNDYLLEQMELSDTAKLETEFERLGPQEEMDDDEIIQLLELEPPETITEIDELTTGHVADTINEETIKTPELETVSQSLDTHGNLEPFDTKSIFQTKRFWQVMTSFVLMLFISAVCVTVWVYSDYRVQQGRLDEAYASIQSIYSEFIVQKDTSDSFQQQVDEAQEKLLQLQNELDQSSALIESLKQQLPQGQ